MKNKEYYEQLHVIKFNNLVEETNILKNSIQDDIIQWYKVKQKILTTL